MRAIFLNEDLQFLQNSDVLEIKINEHETIHHLLHVVRLQANEKILVMRGNGKVWKCEVVCIGKKEVVLHILDMQEFSSPHQLSLAMAIVKREGVESALRIAVELGITSIFPLWTEYSQREWVAPERVQRIVESAMIQSNNPIAPVMLPPMELKNFLQQDLSEYKHLFYFSLETTSPVQKSSCHWKHAEKAIMLVGPEGGFSTNEDTFIRKLPHCYPIHLPTWILRAPSAMAVGAGYVFHLLEQLSQESS